MAEEEKKVEAKKKAPAKKATKKVEEKKEAPKKSFGKATLHDYEVIIDPVITEKTMALMQNTNKVTVRVNADANKTEIKLAFQRIFQVEVDSVKVINVLAKKKTRGGRYQGTVSGYKKAVVAIHEGEAIDLFRE
jgi:large subunit ribosomal protein L23